jgi:hypothetical protein
LRHIRQGFLPMFHSVFTYTATFTTHRLATYCYMLGFLGNMTLAPCCVTMGLLCFLSNATVPVA